MASSRPTGKEVFARLNEQAQNVYTVVINSQSILKPYNVARMLHEQAQQYLEEGDIESAYVQLKKFARMFLEVICKHNSYNMKKYFKEKAKYKSFCMKAIGILEKLKKQIIEKYDKIRAQEIAVATEKLSIESIGTLPKSEKVDQKQVQKISSSALQTNFDILRSNSKQKAKPGVIVKKENDAYPDAPPDVVTQTPAYSPQLYEAKADTKSANGARKEVKTQVKKQVKRQPWDSLRKIVLPSDFAKKFTRAASVNTRRNKETCGLICGRLKNNVFQVTACILPPQSGTANTTAASGEIEIIAILEERKLLTLGWIHTHPSQACFLSSIDLHTQFSYQVCMPEAIAIVIAPTDKRCTEGCFSLTAKGLKVIGECGKSGFHSHPDSTGLYRQAMHVQVSSKLKTAMYDLRKRK